MAYKKMDSILYYGASIALYSLEILMAVLIPSVGVIFNFVSAFSISSLAYIFPGLFYILCENKFGNNPNKCRRFMAFFYIVFGIFAALFVFINTCIEIANS